MENGRVWKSLKIALKAPTISATALKVRDELSSSPEPQEKVHELVRLYKGPQFETVI
jgi:hypothetical protein